MTRKKTIKKTAKKEPKVTDIKRRYFFDEEDGIEKVECTYMNGSKVVKVEVEKS